MAETDDVLRHLHRGSEQARALSRDEVKALLLEAADVIRTLRILVGIREEVEGRAG